MADDELIPDGKAVSQSVAYSGIQRIATKGGPTAVNRRVPSTASRDHASERSPVREDRAELENKLRQRLAKDLLSKRYFAYLTGKAGFDPQYVISSLIRDALGYKVPAQLSTVDIDHLLKQHGPSDLPLLRRRHPPIPRPSPRSGHQGPRRAAVLAYITNQLLHSHRAIQKESDDQPQEIIMDLPRPKRD